MSTRSEEPDRVGQVIADKYQIVSLLGSGGMGSVYEAKHMFLGRRVALKFLHPALAQDAQMVARFHSEAKAAGGLESENLVAVTDFGVTDDASCYLVMEYLVGDDLARLLERVGPLPAVRAVRILTQACRGVGVAHQAQIIHRDLKPQNLFVGRRADGTDLVKVLDFGIAKLRRAAEKSDFSTRTGAAMGTANYMAPEQARSAADVDERADIYALGVILYEALSGKLPHPGETYNQIIAHLLTQPSIPLDIVCPGLPRGLYDIVNRAIASDPQARFDSVDALASALQPHAKPWSAEPGVGETVASPMSGLAGAGQGQGSRAVASVLQSASPMSVSRNGGGADRPSLSDTVLPRIFGARRRTGVFLGLGLVLFVAALWGLAGREGGILATAPEPTASGTSPGASSAIVSTANSVPAGGSAASVTTVSGARDVADASVATALPAAPAATQAKPARTAKANVEPSGSASAPAPIAKAEPGWKSVLVRDISFDGGSKPSGQHGAAGSQP